MPAPPSALTLADGETRAVEKTWPDGGYECPFCSSPAAAGGAGCPNPGCRVNMTAAQLAAARGRDEAESAQRRERESIADFAAKQAADRRAAQDALWVELAAEAGRRGSCLQCLRDSDWRGDRRRAKFVRHRRADYHEGTPASAPSAPERPNQTDHRFRHGDRVEYGLSGPGGRDDLGEVVREDRHQTGDGYLIRPLSGTRGDIHRPVWWPAGMVQDETPGRWLLNALNGSYERNPAAGRTGPSGFDRAKADEQMYAVINRNPGWRFEMVNPGNGAEGHRYRFTEYGRHTGTITVRDDGFHWEIASHQDGARITSGTAADLAEAFQAVTKPPATTAAQRRSYVEVKRPSRAPLGDREARRDTGQQASTPSGETGHLATGLSVVRLRSLGWRVIHDASGLPASPVVRLKRQAGAMMAELYATGADFTQAPAALKKDPAWRKYGEALRGWHDRIRICYDPATGEHYSPHGHDTVASPCVNRQGRPIGSRSPDEIRAEAVRTAARFRDRGYEVTMTREGHFGTPEWRVHDPVTGTPFGTFYYDAQGLIGRQDRECTSGPAGDPELRALGVVAENPRTVKSIEDRERELVATGVPGDEASRWADMGHPGALPSRPCCVTSVRGPHDAECPQRPLIPVVQDPSGPTDVPPASRPGDDPVTAYLRRYAARVAVTGVPDSVWLGHDPSPAAIEAARRLNAEGHAVVIAQTATSGQRAAFFPPGYPAQALYEQPRGNDYVLAAPWADTAGSIRSPAEVIAGYRQSQRDYHLSVCRECSGPGRPDCGQGQQYAAALAKAAASIPPVPAGHTLPAAPSPSHASPQTEGTGPMSHSGALSPTGGGNVPASGNGYTHGEWRTEMATSVAVCNTITFVLDGMEQSLRRLGAGQSQLKWIGLCRTHIEATVAEAVPFVGEINRRYDPITQAVAAAGGQAEVADQKTYYQTD